MEAIEVLARIFTTCHSIALDFNEQLFQEYRQYFDKGKSFLYPWFEQMMSKGKIKYFPLQNLTLVNCPISNDDMKFVDLAVSLPTPRTIITGDPDFLDKKENPEFLQRSIKIVDLEEARKML
jgi:hypothetical protein